MILFWGAKLRNNAVIAARLPFFNFCRAVVWSRCVSPFLIHSWCARQLVRAGLAETTPSFESLPASRGGRASSGSVSSVPPVLRPPAVSSALSVSFPCNFERKRFCLSFAGAKVQLFYQSLSSLREKLYLCSAKEIIPKQV